MTSCWSSWVNLLTSTSLCSHWLRLRALPRRYRDSTAQVWNCSAASHASDSAPLQLLIGTSCSGWIFPSGLIRAVTIPTTALSLRPCSALETWREARTPARECISDIAEFTQCLFTKHLIKTQPFHKWLYPSTEDESGGPAECCFLRLWLCRKEPLWCLC